MKSKWTHRAFMLAVLLSGAAISYLTKTHYHWAPLAVALLTDLRRFAGVDDTKVQP